MSKIYVFTNGDDIISVNGKCYKKTSNTGKITADSSDVIVHNSAEDCKKAN